MSQPIESHRKLSKKEQKDPRHKDTIRGVDRSPSPELSKELSDEHHDERRRDTIRGISRSPTPEVAHRMRISVLKNGEGSRDCPIRMFTFKNQLGLQNAVEKLMGTFGGAFSEYGIVQEGVLGAENGMEDGRTQDIQMKFDSKTADESWHQFLQRMDAMKGDWEVEDLGVKTQRGGGVHAGTVRDVGMLA